MPQPSYLSRPEIAAGQLESIRSLLAELLPANPFYARKLNQAGIAFDVASLEDFSSRFPFTTKSELVDDQREHPPFGTNLTYPLDRYTRCHQTSGTTGTPLRWLDTPDSWQTMVESWMEILQAAAVQASDRIYFAFSFGPFIGFWLAFEAASRLGCLCLPGGGFSSAARLRAMIDNQATVLCCTPTYAIRLAEVAASENLSGRVPIRMLIVAGESGGSIPAVRARLAHLWPGARIFDHHGMTEVGPVTYECPARPGILHVLESAYLPEIIDPAGQGPVPRGQSGELVLTTLGRIASPLLRYRTGDIVRSEVSPCSCGRQEFALAGGILGRTDDMVVIRGVNVFPSAVDEIVRQSSEVAEYRVEISTAAALPEMSVQIEPAPECKDASALVRRLEQKFETAFALRVPVTLVPYKTLPRFELKARRWIKV